jgi:hypothetical protein
MRTICLAILAAILLNLPFLGETRTQAVAGIPVIQQTSQSYSDACPDCGENISGCIVKSQKAASTHIESVVMCALVATFGAIAFCPEKLNVLGQRLCSPSYDKRTTRTHVVLRL